MKRLALFCFVLFCFVFTKQQAQNLVPNPSFENQIDCFNVLITNAVGWCTISSNGGQASSLSPCMSDTYHQVPYQFFNSCFKSYQIPRTGTSYASIATYVLSVTQESSVPQIKLIDTLKAGQMYCVTYYVSLWNNSVYSFDKLGALLTPTPFPCAVPGGTVFVPIAGNVTPQVVTPAGIVFEDTLNWMEVSGSFTAVGNEAYLSIGDFFLHNQHLIKNSYPTNCNGLAEYYVDDVSVEEVEVAKCVADVSLCDPDSVLLGTNPSEAAEYSWSPTAGLSCINCPNPTAYVNQTTTYTLTKKQCKAITTASVTVTVKNDCNPVVSIPDAFIPNVFTPNRDDVNDTFKIELYSATNVSFTIHNRWGNLIHSVPEALEGTNTIIWDGRTTSGEPCSEGVYFYTLKYTDANGEQQAKNGYVSLFR